MKETTLVIMAAGLGSRFGGGGMKQLAKLGPNGEIIMEYSVYDAIRAGFNKIVFVIRRSMEVDFRRIIGDRVSRKIPVSYAFQEIDDLPRGFTVPSGRSKPWGTGHAVLSCRDFLKEPFAVINADDFYGQDAFVKVHNFLVNSSTSSDKKFKFCMAGFILKNTLSEHGGVTRGICRLNEGGELIEILETRDILKTKNGAAVYAGDASLVRLDPDALVSMNFWGFTPDFIDELKAGFIRFLDNLDGNATTAEYLLPTIVDRMLKEGIANITVLPSNDKWFGVTFQDDMPLARQSIADLIKSGAYPESLF